MGAKAHRRVLMEVGATEKGKLGELYVFGQLIKRGAMPFLPIADIRGVDAVIRKKDGTYVEVQIKTTWTEEMAGYFNVPKLDKVNPPRNLFIVGLIMGEELRGTKEPETWIVPSQVFAEHMTKKYLGIGTGSTDKERQLRDKLADYREAWHLLTE